MKTNLKLNSHLTLNYIDEHNSKDDKLITVELGLTFLGKEGNAFVVIEDLENKYPSYAMVEIASEVSSSFF